ncbi:hypothetical protein BUE93_20480 [Chromobacterium amazonense]|uniref:DUF6933 domain-containing protein n=1 Tax=Chromobacterium amazonense TaxID=1382803 RepID=A0A2S9WZK0_9NEIS|nr:hypothetical protein [Chromobacterium amazonense]PRP68826.1 hypothetical protein BUE93_20480 [Chromobacterium amazonense]
MAFLSLTKKAAAILQIDITQADTHELGLPEMEDWIVDTIWPEEKVSPGILFYNRATGFTVALNPAQYTVDYCLGIVKQLLERFLSENGMAEKMPYFHKLFGIIHICKNSDRSATGYISKSKMLINYWTDSESSQRVSNSYDLMNQINIDYRKVNGEYHNTRIQDFLSSLGNINDRSGIILLKKTDVSL